MSHENTTLYNILAAVDELGDARHMAEAIYMAAEGLGSREANALQAVVVAMQAKLDQVSEEITQAVAALQPAEVRP